jgi:large subunit ribosomal protein L13
MKTISITPANIEKQWVLVDAEGQTLGRLASEISRVLRGKNKPTFVPHLDCGDYVIVINADKVNLTGNKLVNKVYHHHTGYMGGLKSIKAEDLLVKNPTKILTLAVRGMLPKNKLARKVIKNLKVYAGSEHPHTAQKTIALTARTKGVK